MLTNYAENALAPDYLQINLTNERHTHTFVFPYEDGWVQYLNKLLHSLSIESVSHDLHYFILDTIVDDFPSDNSIVIDSAEGISYSFQMFPLYEMK